MGVFFGALIAFGCGYDFWVICGTVAVAIAVFQISSQTGRRRKLITFAWIGAGFALPFVIRQGQVIFALGAEYWWQDIVFSLAIKIPGATNLISIPSIPEIDAFYRAHHVLRPPASPTNDVVHILLTLRHMVQSVTVPRWGIITVSTFCLLLLVGAIGRLGALQSRYVSLELTRCLQQLLLPMSGGIVIGLAAFAPFSLHVYLKHEFPLVAFPLLIGKGLAIYGLGTIIVSHWRRLPAYVAAAAIAFLLLDVGMVHRNASANGLYPNLEWRHFVQSHPSSRFLVSTYGSASWLNSGLIDIADPILGLTDAHKTYADPIDARGTAITLGEGVTSDRADYWVYQPVEQTVEFDSSVPSCKWRDWILGPVADSLPYWLTPTKLDTPWISPPRAGLSTTLSFGGILRGHRRSDMIEVSTSPPIPPTRGLVYNCIYQTLIGWATIDQPTSGNLTTELIARHANGRRDLLYRFTTPVIPDSLPVGPIAVPRRSQPTIPELISLAGRLKVVARDDAGIGYVIFEVPK